jgi:zinc protease
MKFHPLKAAAMLATLALLVTVPMTVAQARSVEVDIERDDRVPIAYVNVLLSGGSVADPQGMSGLTQFVGQMLTRGTRTLTKEQIDLKLDQWGAQLGVETRLEFTVIRGAVLSEKLPDFLKLLEEILLEPGMSEGEIAKLKDETVSGLMEELANDHLVSTKKFAQALFEKHPYGRPTAGVASQIRTFDRATLLQHHVRLMNPARAVFLGSGDIHEATLGAWANRVAGRMPGREVLAAFDAPRSPAGRRLQIVDKPDRTQTQILIGQLGTLMGDPDYFALYLGNAAFGGGSFTSRLMQEIRVKRGWSYGAGSSFRFGTRPRSWQVHLFPAAKDTPQALELTLKLIERLKEEGLTQAEFELARKSALNSAAFVADTPKKRTENRIIEKALGLPEGFFEGFAGRLEKVTLDEVNRALKKFLDPSRLSISVLGTAKDLRDDLARAAGVSQDQVSVVPYTSE